MQALAVLPAPPVPQIVTLYPTDDAQVSSRFPDVNFGSEIHLRVGGEEWNEYRSFIRFDLSEIVSIISAKLQLFYWQWITSNPLQRECEICRVIESWAEGTVTWNTVPAVTTVNRVFSNIPYYFGWWEIDLTAMTQDALPEDEVSYRIRYKMPDNLNGSCADFASKEKTPARIPELVITQF